VPPKSLLNADVGRFEKLKAETLNKDIPQNMDIWSRKAEPFDPAYFCDFEAFNLGSIG
jgi:hypothetical protein